MCLVIRRKRRWQLTVTVFDNNTNTKVGEAVTKEDGSYLIPNLPNGDYRVEFSNLPKGYEVTPSKQGNNEEFIFKRLIFSYYS
ncbi:SdrD B-like domain-containing protein [Staphylococcus aureus]